MVGRLILVLGDQNSLSLEALKQADQAVDSVLMAEVMAETTYVRHHPKKIAFVLSAMRHHAARLRAAGWDVHYTHLEDPQNTGTLATEVLRHAQRLGVHEVLVTHPGEWRLIADLQALPLRLRILPDTRFIAQPDRFRQWAKGRKQLRMEYFYRELRRETGLLMDGDAPAGGKWNYDHDNRKAAAPDLLRQPPISFAPDAITREVLDMVERRFGDHFGDLRPFGYAVTSEDAEAALQEFLVNRLPGFGDIQDAMLRDDAVLNHAVIGLYLNAGLLDPLDVCRRCEAEYRAGRAPLNSVEGFIRQILGWREYVRGLYFHEGPDYTRRNALGHHRALPALFWGGPTRMACVAEVVRQTQARAYAHHIQRLMVVGNFALLAGLDPRAVHEWYLAVYADAYEWVEAPNVIGMSQFADGGIVASKPYVSSGNYINKMSDYCAGCSYSVTRKTGPGACPFNLLYWQFLERHRDHFAANPRMRQIYATWDRMDPAKRATVIREAQGILDQLDDGVPV